MSLQSVLSRQLVCRPPPFKPNPLTVRGHFYQKKSSSFLASLTFLDPRHLARTWGPRTIYVGTGKDVEHIACHYSGPTTNQLAWMTTFEFRFQNWFLNLNSRGEGPALSKYQQKNILSKKLGFKGFHIWRPGEGTKYHPEGFSLHWLLTIRVKGHRWWTLDYWPLTCLVKEQ